MHYATMPKATLAVLALCLAGASTHCVGPATYRVSNVCSWTNVSHPTDFPANAMFSPMCGTAHNEQYIIFQEGGLASEGVQQVAETGECGLLEGEIDVCVMDGSCTVGGYFSWMCDASQNQGTGNGTCSHSGMIEVTPEFPYVSMVSMVAPSPDWFIGVAGVNLCVKNASTGGYDWIERYPLNTTTNLYAYDAGTDSGTTFNSTDIPTTPPEAITQFVQRNASNIFYNQEVQMLFPLCRLMLEKA